MSIKGWPPPVSSGYGGPKVSRGLHPSGYEEVMVYNVEQVSKVTPNTQAVRIAHTVGKRKRTGILAEARRKKIVVLNMRQAKEAAEKKLAEEKEEKEEKGDKKAQAQRKEAEEATASEKAQSEKKTKKDGGGTKQQ
jgi:large subunit ribosomal protein L32e